MIAIKDFTDITYATDRGVGIITINRPDRYNALRGRTVDELLAAFKYAWVDQEVGAVILTGTGEKAFCTGGDQKERAETGGYGETETGMFEIESLHKLIRAIPKPVIAAVNGFAIGGGHVLHVLCDLSIASTNAVCNSVLTFADLISSSLTRSRSGVSDVRSNCRVASHTASSPRSRTSSSNEMISLRKVGETTSVSERSVSERRSA